MRIKRPDLDRLTAYQTSKAERKKEAGKLDHNKRSNSAEKPIFDISDESRLIQQVREALDRMPDVRPEMEELMKELQQKLDEGTYLDEVSGKEVLAEIKKALIEQRDLNLDFPIPFDVVVG